MSRVDLKNRTIWITGASSGIGNTLALMLAERGNKVIASGRDELRLRELKRQYPNSIEILLADISCEESVPAMSRGLRETCDFIDTVILNAGTCEYIDVSRFDSRTIEKVFQVNLVGAARCIEASLPLLVNSSRKPHIVGIASAAALTGLPRAEAYGASKAALVSMLESLALDLDPKNIDVSIVYPGFVDTPLTKKNDFSMPFILGPEQAAQYIVQGIEKRRSSITFPWPLIWGLKLMAALPSNWRHSVGLRMLKT